MEIEQQKLRGEVVQATGEAKELIRAIQEELGSAGRWTEAGRPVAMSFGVHREWPVAPRLKAMVEGCIAEVIAAVGAAWEDPAALKVKRLKKALIHLKAGRATMRQFDELASVIGSSAAQRILHQQLDALET